MQFLADLDDAFKCTNNFIIGKQKYVGKYVPVAVPTGSGFEKPVDSNTDQPTVRQCLGSGSLCPEFRIKLFFPESGNPDPSSLKNALKL